MGRDREIVWFNRVGISFILIAMLVACGGDATMEPQAATSTPIPTSTGAEKMAQQYSAPPALTLDTTHSYKAIFKTIKGDITVELFADKTPITVNNFVFLAREGYYDNTVFHRVIPDFMVQGGDPTGTGMGGPGYRFQDEFDATLKHDKPGILSMANAGPGTNGSQFFLTHVPTPHLDGRHSVFGHVVEGLDVLMNIAVRDPGNSSFPGDALNTIEIVESGS